MYNQTMIVLSDYLDLVDRFADPQSRMRWGVLAQPIEHNGKYLLPLGWEEELDKVEIAYTIEEIEFIIEEVI